MKPTMIVLTALLITVGTAAGQEAGTTAPKVKARISTGELHPTPEMWFYEQELQRYNDSKLAVRKKAEFRAAQRERRLAAMQWLGMSNARPIASPTPVMGTYSPMWTSNYIDPFRWMGVRATPYTTTDGVSVTTGFYGLW
jgi:hypothetical protein